eukprot:6418395-Pyramimonas_sp.AAC.1
MLAESRGRVAQHCPDAVPDLLCPFALALRRVPLALLGACEVLQGSLERHFVDAPRGGRCPELGDERRMSHDNLRVY